MKQDIFKFSFPFKDNNFFVTDKNYFAYNLVKSWPNWTNQLVYIYGPEKCGKTLISNLWSDNAKAKYLSNENFCELIKDEFDIEYISKFNWVLDDIDKLIEKNSHLNKKVLNFINILKTNKNLFLLMTAQKSPKYIECKLDDLTSRLLTSVVVEVKYPDKELLCKIIQKYLNDRNIILSESNISFISDRIERSYESALNIAKKIDEESLQTKSRITTVFLKRLFD